MTNPEKRFSMNLALFSARPLGSRRLLFRFWLGSGGRLASISWSQPRRHLPRDRLAYAMAGRGAQGSLEATGGARLLQRRHRQGPGVYHRPVAQGGGQEELAGRNSDVPRGSVGQSALAILLRGLSGSALPRVAFHADRGRQGSLRLRAARRSVLPRSGNGQGCLAKTDGQRPGRSERDLWLRGIPFARGRPRHGPRATSWKTRRRRIPP